MAKCFLATLLACFLLSVIAAPGSTPSADNEGNDYRNLTQEKRCKKLKNKESCTKKTYCQWSKKSSCEFVNICKKLDKANCKKQSDKCIYWESTIENVQTKGCHPYRG